MSGHGSARSHLTLALCTILHGFTHAYGSMLVPLYFRIADDLKLSGVGAATLIVTLYGAVYNLASYAAGLAADRFSRKTLLAIGLLGNATAILAIGLSRQYSHILMLGVAAGLFGTIFHPSANALASSHYPKRREWPSAFWGSVRAWAFSSARKSPVGAPRRPPGNSGTSPNGKSPASRWPLRGWSSESSSCSSAPMRRLRRPAIGARN